VNNVTEKPRKIDISITVKGRNVGQLVNLMADKLREKEPRVKSRQPTEGGHRDRTDLWVNFVDCKMSFLHIKNGLLRVAYKSWRIKKSERR